MRKETQEEKVERCYREWHRLAEYELEGAQRRVVLLSKNSTFTLNQYFLDECQQEETLSREIVEGEYFHFLMGHKGHLALQKSRQEDSVKLTIRQDIKCHEVYGRIAQKQLKEENEIGDRDRALGRIALKEERSRAAAEQKERERAIERRRVERESLTKAFAFIGGEQTRHRYVVEQAQTTSWQGVLESEKKAIEELDGEIAARWMTTDEGRRQLAEEEARVNEEKRKANAKASAHKKDQHNMSHKCTHSRQGGSVFLGSFPKKMCLICRVKFDAKTGLYHRM